MLFSLSKDGRLIISDEILRPVSREELQLLYDFCKIVMKRLREKEGCHGAGIGTAKDGNADMENVWGRKG